MLNVYRHAANAVNAYDAKEAAAKSALTSWLTWQPARTGSALDDLKGPLQMACCVVLYSEETETVLVQKLDNGTDGYGPVREELPDCAYPLMAAQKLVRERFSVPAHYVSTSPAFLSIEDGKGEEGPVARSSYWYVSRHVREVEHNDPSLCWVKLHELASGPNQDLARFAMKLQTTLEQERSCLTR